MYSGAFSTTTGRVDRPPRFEEVGGAEETTIIDDDVQGPLRTNQHSMSRSRRRANVEVRPTDEVE